MSDKIESFITELLKTESDNEWVELRRNELAAIFRCAPSQINYVIATRFNTNSGYIVESRRGGGGYLKIRRIDTASENPIYSAIQSISERLDYIGAKRRISELFTLGAIDKKIADMLLAAISDNAITIAQPERDKVRAGVLKNALAALI